jgi:DNA-binding protein H-NS
LRSIVCSARPTQPFGTGHDRFVPESPAPASCGGSTINWTMNMKLHDLELMSVDELWLLHLEIRSALASRISADKRKLEHRLEQLRLSGASEVPRHERRPYPRVFPKYRNPAKPEETWAGRGKQPRWLPRCFEPANISTISGFSNHPIARGALRGGDASKGRDRGSGPRFGPGTDRRRLQRVLF